MHIFEKINKPCVNYFASLNYKDNLSEILRKFPKILKVFLQNIARNALF